MWWDDLKNIITHIDWKQFHFLRPKVLYLFVPLGLIVLLLIIGNAFFSGDALSETATTVQNTYAPNGDIQPRTYHSTDANATVLELDGLEDIPADSKVVGYKVHHSETNHQVARTTLYSDRGEVLQVLAMNDASEPRMTVP